MDYNKPIYFRPSNKDTEVLELIAQQHETFSESLPDLLRIALQNYWFEHGPDSKRSKSARLDRHEKLLLLICEKLGIDTDVVDLL